MTSSESSKPESTTEETRGHRVFKRKHLNAQRPSNPRLPRTFSVHPLHTNTKWVGVLRKGHNFNNPESSCFCYSGGVLFCQSGRVPILPIRMGPVFAIPEGSYFSNPEGSYFCQSRRVPILPSRRGPVVANPEGTIFANSEGSSIYNHPFFPQYT